MFDLSQLRCFVAVAEERHFGRAAQRLNMTQPPLSRQIQLLEHALEVKLFERTSRSVRLTRAGETFLLEARRLLRLSEAAALEAKRVALGEAGSLALGFTAASGYDFLPRLINAFRVEAPGSDLVLKEMVSADQIEALAAGRIDAGLLRPPFNMRELQSVCVVREDMMLALPSSHPLAERKTIAISDLDRQPMIAYSPYEARYFYDLLSRICADAGISPDFVQHISQIHSILGLVRAGLGLALVPKAAANLRFVGVVVRGFTPALRPRAELHLAWRRSNENPAVAKLARLSQQV